MTVSPVFLILLLFLILRIVAIVNAPRSRGLAPFCGNEIRTEQKLRLDWPSLDCMEYALAEPARDGRND